MQKRTICLGIFGCIAAMISAVGYAFTRLYIMNLRVDLSILVVNIVVFSISAGLLVYLTRKEHNIEEEELFRD